MKDKQPAHKSTETFQKRFEEENAVALAEAAEEQRRLREKRKKAGTPDRMFLPDLPEGTAIIICRRK